MNIFVLNTNFEVSIIIDSYESFIWTDRYRTTGDFEIYLPFDYDIFSNVLTGYYVRCPYSDHLMIVEDIAIDTDSEIGMRLTISGRSIECILDRRIIWGEKVLSGDINTCIKTVINENIISPTITDRAIDNFVYIDSVDGDITGTEISAQFNGDNLLDVVESLCAECDCGYQLIPSDAYEFIFSLYTGTDHSFNQSVYPYIIFSQEFDNLFSSNYYNSISNYKNVTLIGGEGEGTEQTTTTYGTATGIDRREIYTDASSLSTNDGEISSEDYIAQLQTKGKENLDEYQEVTTFEGESEYDRTFVYNSDYFVGDIVQLESNLGVQSRARVVESIISDDSTGLKIYPSFEIIE